MLSELTRLRVSRQIPAKEIVAVVQKEYPSFDKVMLSKCERGDKYGVTLKPHVMDKIIDELAPDAREPIRRRIRGGHRLTHRIMCRLENDEYDLLQQLRERDGYKTMQDLISDLIKNYVKGAHNND